MYPDSLQEMHPICDVEFGSNHALVGDVEEKQNTYKRYENDKALVAVALVGVLDDAVGDAHCEDEAETERMKDKIMIIGS